VARLVEGHQRPELSINSSRRGSSIRSAWSIPVSSCRRKDQGRLVAYYAGADLMSPMKPGQTRTDNAPFPGGYLRPDRRLSAAAACVSTLPDMVAHDSEGLLPGGKTLLKPETIAQMMDQPVARRHSAIRFAMMERQPARARASPAADPKPSPLDHPDAAGETLLGRVAGTQWWISPKRNMAGVMMAQRQMSFVHPFSFEFKRLAYEAVKQKPKDAQRRGFVGTREGG
jgi:CubicO group peptidase (beta-lactamase class C family)